MTATVCLSVVSHGQAALVQSLLQDLEKHRTRLPLQVLLTLNIPETLPFEPDSFSFPVTLIRNAVPQGFGTNHNAAFRHCPVDSAYFCVVNPDIRLQQAVVEALASALNRDPAAGVAAPRVLSPQGKVEDSARRLPTPWSILAKALGRVEPPPAGEPDWVAGMFMLFPAPVFREIGGFDEGYHLYYEDVEICCRLRLAGRTIHLLEHATVIHDARRESHRSWRYLRWHLASMARFFTSAAFWRCWLRS